jgi:hypothetical protein
VQLIGDVAEVDQHFRNVDGSAGKERFKGPTLLRGFRMKRKRGPAKVDVKFLLQSFNTPGNEIAPGSDIIRKNFQDVAVRHDQRLSGAVTTPWAWIAAADSIRRKIERPDILRAR